MSISRDTFDPAKNYKRVRYHQDRDLLDSELNEQQDIINNERRKLADILFKEGAIVSGFGVTVAVTSPVSRSNLWTATTLRWVALLGNASPLVS